MVMQPPGLARIPAALIQLLYIAAAGFFITAAAVHVLTYTPLGSADVIQTLTFVLFPGIFPVFGAVVLILVGNRIRLDGLMFSFRSPSRCSVCCCWHMSSRTSS